MTFSIPSRTVPIPPKIGHLKGPPLSPMAVALKNLRPGYSIGIQPYSTRLQSLAIGIMRRWKIKVVTRRMPDGSLRVWRVEGKGA